MRRRDRIAGLWLLVWFTAAGLARLLTHDTPELQRVLLAPSLSHPLGFDAFGRDLLQSTLRASVSSATFALAAVLASLGIGLAAGLALALSQARIAAAGRALLDALLAFPSLLLALGLAAVRGPGWGTLLGSLAIGTMPGFARLILVRSRELRQEDYVLASRAIGATQTRIALRHLLPAQLSLCAIKAPNLFAQTLMAEATLSFLGVGAPIGSETWGGLLAQGHDYLIEAPHLAIGTGLPLVATVLCLQVLAQDLAEKSWNASGRGL